MELKRIQQEVGITFVYVTHDQDEALTMSDRIAVMEGGSILQIGAPNEVYDDPRSRFVAGFVGVSNVLELLEVDRVENGRADCGSARRTTSAARSGRSASREPRPDRHDPPERITLIEDSGGARQRTATPLGESGRACTPDRRRASSSTWMVAAS